MGVIAETMMALVLAQRCSRSSAADALSETKRNFEGMWHRCGRARRRGRPRETARRVDRPAGVGKSTVGRLVAEQLRAGFVDIDAIVERREGRPIAMIFAEKGEAAFRDMERKEMEAALASEPAVIAPGGGWAAQPGAIDGAKPHALVIYLYTRPETATATRGARGNPPALSGEDPVAAYAAAATRARRVLSQRARAS